MYSNVCTNAQDQSILARSSSMVILVIPSTFCLEAKLIVGADDMITRCRIIHLQQASTAILDAARLETSQ